MPNNAYTNTVSLQSFKKDAWPIFITTNIKIRNTTVALEHAGVIINTMFSRHRK